MKNKHNLKIHEILEKGVSAQLLIQVRSMLDTADFLKLSEELEELNAELQSKHYTSSALRVGRTLELLIYTFANAWGVRLDVPFVKAIEELRQNFASVSNTIVDYYYSESEKKDKARDRVEQQTSKLSSNITKLVFSLDNLNIDENDKKRTPLQISAILRDVKQKFSSIEFIREEVDNILNGRELDSLRKLRNNAAHPDIFGNSVVIDEFRISEMVENLNSILSSLVQINENVPKRLGFGISNEKTKTREDRIKAIKEVRRLLERGKISQNTLEALSVVKGMFNRVLKKDQWDWHTVYLQFGRPRKKACHEIVSNLKKLRDACRDGVDFEKAGATESFMHRSKQGKNRVVVEKVEAIDILKRDSQFIRFLDNYITGRTTYEAFPQIYLLSKKNENSDESLLVGCAKQTIFEVLESVNKNESEPYGIRANWEIFADDLPIKKVEKELSELFPGCEEVEAQILVKMEFLKTVEVIENYLQGYEL